MMKVVSTIFILFVVIHTVQTININPSSVKYYETDEPSTTLSSSCVVDPNRGTAYLTMQGHRGLSVFSLSQRKQINNVTIMGAWPNATEHGRLVYSYLTQQTLLVGGINSLNVVSVVNPTEEDATGVVLGTLNVVRYNHTVTLFGDYVYVVGGHSAAFSVYDFMETRKLMSPLFDSHKFVRVNVSFTIFSHTCVVAQNRLYLLGGLESVGGDPTNNARRAIVMNNSVAWWLTQRLNYGRHSHAAVVVNDSLIVVFGGIGDSQEWLSSMEAMMPGVYDGVWLMLSPDNVLSATVGPVITCVITKSYPLFVMVVDHKRIMSINISFDSNGGGGERGGGEQPLGPAHPPHGAEPEKTPTGLFALYIIIAVLGAIVIVVLLGKARKLLCRAQQFGGSSSQACMEEPMVYAAHSIEDTQTSSGIFTNSFSSTCPRVLKGWVLGQLLGKGSYGEVYQGICPDGTMIAVKVIDLKAGITDTHVKSIIGEVQLMQGIPDHPNIVRYLGCSVNKDQRQLNIFMEYVQGGTLGALCRKVSLPERAAAKFTLQILQGLKHLHDLGIIHRDIKGDNILLQSEGFVKLADFGTAKKFEAMATQGTQSIAGTPLWMAPEVVAGIESNKTDKKYDAKADVWSVGCTVVEMLNNGKPPWPLFRSLFEAIYTIGSTKELPPNIPTHISSQCLSFLHRCFEIDVEKRASVEELLNHPFVRSTAGEDMVEASVCAVEAIEHEVTQLVRTHPQAAPVRNDSSRESEAAAPSKEECFSNTLGVTIHPEI